jgi:uncharacterized protein
MRLENARILFSATDLANFLGCKHATELDRAVVEGRLKKDHRKDHMLDLLIELGERHERRYIEHLKASGKTVIELEKFSDPDGTRTIDAMRNGADVIVQGRLVDEPWGGFPDFLLKVQRPSKLGDWSYEVADTKLSTTTKATAVLQLCLYTELVTNIQCIQPEFMYVIKPDTKSDSDPFDIDQLRVDDYMAYYRMARQSFEEKLASEPDGNSKPERCNHCQICNWWPTCEKAWRAADHLAFVAGISKSQRVELVEQGITSLTQFAEAEEPVRQHPKRGSLDAYYKVHRQAKIQLKGRQTGNPEYEFNDIDKERGFLLLPEPNPGDVFFDLEGNPRASGDGLEYLFGYVTNEGSEPRYHKFWALNRKEERQVFEQFIDWILKRWEQFPDMHIYHYAPYEPSALKRMMTKHATREDDVDRLLRGGKLVDLYAVTRQAIRASVESYSIKKLERFYGYERLELLEEASKALREVERLIELDMTREITADQQEIVELYNQDDCLSTLQLHQWLEKLRGELCETGIEIPRRPLADPNAKDSVKEMSAEAKRVFDLLTFDIEDAPVGARQESRWQLAHMLEYFRREEKCVWWEFKHMCGLEHEDLLMEPRALSGLEFITTVEVSQKANLPVHRYRYPEQEAMLAVGDTLRDLSGLTIGTIDSIDVERCTVDIKKTAASVELHAYSVFEFTYIDPHEMPGSLLGFGEQLAKGAENGVSIQDARLDLLQGARPRFYTLSLPHPGDDIVRTAKELAFDLDHSCLAIQGPPGSGKTYVGSQMILALANSGKRVGVTAVGHEVIRNLLDGVHKRATEQGAHVSLAHKAEKKHDWPAHIGRLANRKKSLEAMENGYVVGGTAWLWSHPDCEQQLDYLFIDEAGQMSLAMALAAGRAAKNIILLGDPQQLEQPQQAIHPHDSGVSALAHILHGRDTIQDDEGLFLSQTWRLHPGICQFTSEQYYNNRLTSRDGLEVQKVIGNSAYTGSGLHVVTIEHEGIQNRSQEEVAVIADIFSQLLNGQHESVTREDGVPVQKPLTIEDILVVAPFNAQVNAIRERLPEGARVGTVDKFQGQEAPIVIYSMTSSSAEDAPRGISFLYSRNRLNVATSRAKCLAILVCSPSILTPDCNSPEHLRLANGICRFEELARTCGNR